MRWWLVVPVLLAVLVAPASAAWYYEVSDLGWLPDWQGRHTATGVNNNGQVVGYAGGGGFGGVPFIWDSVNGMRLIPGTSDDWVDVTGINDAGMVAGASSGMFINGGTLSVAMAWVSNNGGIVQWVDAERQAVWAGDINEFGQTVGHGKFMPGGDQYDAFIVTPSGSLRKLDGFYLDALGNSWEIAVGLNNLGVVCGHALPSENDPNVVACYWDAAGTPHNLGRPANALRASLHDINDAGLAIAWGMDSSSVVGSSYLWSQGAGFQFIGDFAAQRINEQGQVVGNGAYGAVLWDAGQLRNLNDYRTPTSDGWYLMAAMDINEKGQIVGRGQNAAGQEKPVLLNPVAYDVTVRGNWQTGLGGGSWSYDVTNGFPSTDDSRFDVLQVKVTTPARYIDVNNIWLHGFTEPTGDVWQGSWALNGDNIELTWLCEQGNSVDPGETLSGFAWDYGLVDGAPEGYVPQAMSFSAYDASGNFLDSGEFDQEGEVTPELSSGTLLILSALPMGFAWWRRRRKA